MNEKILDSVKTICNVAIDDQSFDNDLVLYTNSALMVVMQEWHGMDHAFRIQTGDETWADLLGGDVDYEGVKELIGLKVRLMFDPPTSQAVMQAITDQIRELEWRMYIWKDNIRIDEENS